MHLGKIRHLILCTFVLLSGLPAAAQTAEVVLTVNRAVNGITDLTELTRADLLRLPQVELVTENEFVDGPTRFSGPLARDVLDTVGRGPSLTITLTAANDYQVEIPIAEIDKYDVLFALTQDGKQFSRRDKGPIWVIYPMSQHRELQDPVFNSRLIWQLVRLDIR